MAEPMIKNHYSAKLSDLDVMMVKNVPPGGNWKNIPDSIPSKRLEQIRIGFEKGSGSRSTYYGKLLPNKPAYTISTYFNRPGNGCFIHYAKDQHRLISQREAARLQSFPDDFEFIGSKTSINKQIGNAVPPLLAYQIAKHIDKKGIFVDLFAGAGGLSLGFKWAGWESIVANDIDPVFLKTYAKNIHPNVIVGDIRNRKVFDNLVKVATEIRKKHKDKPFYILGGPPCQGFSTAGNKRSREDERNSLFNNYKEIVEVLKPDGFVFENVMGMLNMEKGKFFQEIKEALESVIDSVSIWKISTEEYAVPQRRKRIVLVGKKKESNPINPPPKFFDPKDADAHFICAEDALSDLPPLNQGEDGSEKSYVSEPKNNYQALMRNKMSPDEFLKKLT